MDGRGYSKYIKSMGVELEGGINASGYRDCETHYRTDLIDEKFQMGTDGTATVSGVEKSGLEWRYWDFNLNDFDDLFGFVEYCFDKGFKTSTDCGFHMHLRFKDMEKFVTMFSYPSFQKKFVSRYVKEFGKDKRFLDRLDATYSIAEWSPQILEMQLNQMGSARRTAINLGAYSKHRTLEIRLFPGPISKEEALNDIKWVIKNVDEIIDEIDNGEQSIFKLNLKKLGEFVNMDDGEKDEEPISIQVNFDSYKKDFETSTTIVSKKTPLIKDMSQFMYKQIEDYMCEIIKKNTGEDPRTW